MTLRLSAALALVSVLSASCGEEVHSGPDPELGDARVLFERRDDGGTVVYVLDRSRGTEAPLTPAGERNWGARLSPDGRQVAYMSFRDANYEIYRMDLDGDEPVNLTRHRDYDVMGAWSPDGGRLAFMSTRGFELDREDGPFPGHLYVMAADGSDLHQVTEQPLTSSLGPSDWSPDGRLLLLARDVGGQIDVFSLDPESGVERRLTDHPADEYGAVFSHAGDRIAFHAEEDDVSGIVVMGLDGANRRDLTSGDGVHYGPRWSPDDRWLLVTRLAEGSDPPQYDVVAIAVDDGRVEPLVATEADERAGDWLPGR